MDSLKPAHILIVEDEQPIRSMLCASLSQGGYDVEEAANGAQARELLEQDHFDMVLTDLKMPIMDGEALIRWIRERDASLPIIVMSGYMDDAVVSRLDSLGVRYRITKPFRPRVLKELLLDALAS